jgi:uncharacterized protein YjbI with pentapeptide repeats
MPTGCRIEGRFWIDSRPHRHRSTAEFCAQEGHHVTADLCEADLSGALLPTAKAAYARLVRANLMETDMHDADFFEANLQKAIQPA